MTNSIKFKIISSDGKVFSDTIDALYVFTTGGEIGILPNHFPLVARIEISVFKTIKGGKTNKYAISGGLLNVESDSCYILADTFEAEADLDKARATKEKMDAEKILNNRTE